MKKIYIIIFLIITFFIIILFNTNNFTFNSLNNKNSYNENNLTNLQNSTQNFETIYSYQNKKFKQGPIFSINTPVKASDKYVSGNGPTDVPIVLIDISEMGRLLAETKIDKQGNYKFVLDEPLIPGHSIGLKIGDLSNTNFHYEDFIYSDTYTDMPLIGIILSKTSVEK